jgi:hypothetical protein
VELERVRLADREEVDGGFVVGREEPTVLLHVGDLDKHGRYLFGALAEDVAAFAESDGGDFTYVRAALTQEQAAEYELPVYKDAIQAEALPPDALAEIVEAAVLGYYDEDVAAEVARQERQQHAEVDRMLAELRGQLDLPEA